MDINTQQSFEALSERAVAVVVDPIQSVKGKVTEFKTLIVKNVHTCTLDILLFVAELLGGLSLHLNHLIASRMANYDWPFGTLPFGLFWSNLDTRDLETYPRTYSGHF